MYPRHPGAPQASPGPRHTMIAEGISVSDGLAAAHARDGAPGFRALAMGEPRNDGANRKVRSASCIRPSTVIPGRREASPGPRHTMSAGRTPALGGLTAAHARDGAPGFRALAMGEPRNDGANRKVRSASCIRPSTVIPGRREASPGPRHTMSAGRTPALGGLTAAHARDGAPGFRALAMGEPRNDGAAQWFRVL